MNVLLTGFEPFGGSKINPSEQVVRRIVDDQPVSGIEVVPLILPVDRDQAPMNLITALEAHKPDAVLCLGEASRRACISVERIAINLMDYRIPDNHGNLVQESPIIPDGPAAYFSSLPVRKISRAIREAGIPVELSLSAGAFLCNQVMYVLLHTLAQWERPAYGGFIHLPALPEQAAAQPAGTPSMALETSFKGVKIALEMLRKEAVNHD